MRALVTGGAGFVGSHIADALLRRGWDVVAIDNLEARVHPQGRPKWLNRDFPLIVGDIRNKSDWEKALKGVYCVFHQAAYQDYMPDYSNFFQTNVVGTTLLFEVIREFKLDIQKIVLASSQSVYGEGQYHCPDHSTFLAPPRSIEQLRRRKWEVCCPQCERIAKPLPLCEDYPNPFNQYAISKYCQELTALRLGQFLEIPVVALRYSITQGPRQSPFNAYSGICRIFALRMLHGLPPIVYEDGGQLRDYVHVDDVVEANLFALENNVANFQVFNVGGGVGITVLEYQKLLAEVLKIEIPPEISGKFRLGDNRHSVSSIKKLQSLGWSPKKQVPEILRDYVDWLLATGTVGEYFREAEDAMNTSGVVLSSEQPSG